MLDLNCGLEGSSPCASTTQPLSGMVGKGRSIAAGGNYVIVANTTGHLLAAANCVGSRLTSQLCASFPGLDEVSAGALVPLPGTAGVAKVVAGSAGVGMLLHHTPSSVQFAATAVAVPVPPPQQLEFVDILVERVGGSSIDQGAAALVVSWWCDTVVAASPAPLLFISNTTTGSMQCTHATATSAVALSGVDYVAMSQVRAHSSIHRCAL